MIVVPYWYRSDVAPACRHLVRARTPFEQSLYVLRLPQKHRVCTLQWSNEAHSEVATAAHRAPRVLFARLQVARKADGVEAVSAAHCPHRLA